MKYCILCLLIIVFPCGVFSQIADAARSGDMAELENLLKQNKNPDDVTVMGTEEKTGIMIAADQMNPGIAALLIKYKANVNFKTQYTGTTAVMYIMSLTEDYNDSSLKILKMLADAGADFNAKDKNGWNALMYAAYSGNNPQLIESFIRFKPDVNKTSPAGESALYIAADNGYSFIVQILMKAGADASKLKRENKFQTAALHAAVEKGHADAVRIMLENRADVNVRTKGGFGGRTPLHIAVEGRNVDLVKLLLRYKADVNAKDDAGATPLYDAGMGGGPELGEIHDLLVKAGAKK